MKLIGDVIFAAAGDILTGLVNMTKKRAIIYMLQAKVVPFMMDYKLISPLPASGWRRTR